jgi:uncharacterized protein (DUF983 family)
LKTEAQEVRKVKIIFTVLGLLAVAAIFVIAALLNISGWIALIVTVPVLFALGWVEAEKEDKILVKHRGVWK